MASNQEKVSMQVRAVRTGLSMLGVVAPSVAGRSATDLFLRSRHDNRIFNDTAPLGAQVLPLAEGLAVKQAYQWGKSGPLVLLVHGWASDSSSMYSLARALSRQGYRAIAFDAPAHGVSPGDKTTMTEVVEAAGEVMDALEQPLHAVISHSLGGVAAVAAISRQSRRLPRHLVLVAAPCSLSDMLEGFARYMHLRPSVVTHVRGELLRRNGVPVDHWDIRTLGQQMGMPTLIVHDESDTLVPFQQARMIEQVFSSSARLEQTRGLGHRRILVDPSVHQKVLSFLDPSAARA